MPSLTIETEKVVVERLNHPYDFYIYFKGGFVVWSFSQDAHLSKWINGRLFTLEKKDDIDPENLHWRLNKWISEQVDEIKERKRLLLDTD